MNIWSQISYCKEYQQSFAKAIKILLPFPTRYLCETGVLNILQPKQHIVTVCIQKHIQESSFFVSSQTFKNLHDVLQNCVSETCIIQSISISPINSIKRKKLVKMKIRLQEASEKVSSLIFLKCSYSSLKIIC